MKRAITFLVLSGIFAVSCNQSDKKAAKEKEQAPASTNDTTVTTEQTKPPSGELESLRKFEGQYPTAVKLLEDPVLKPRLEKLLGGRLAFLKEYWNVESPIEIKNNMFIASGCQAHNCGSTNFIIVADLVKNILSVGLREEMKVERFIETGNSPDALEKWVTGN